ncbi:MAG: sel1 repeat family protein [Magnetococcales bacterium]|nr:sel1 repeat family protein [Magnetococcales bacterium]
MALPEMISIEDANPMAFPPSDMPKGLHALGGQDDYLTALVTMAEWGDPKAQHNLGALFLEGREVIQDYAEAFKWHSLAAEQGMAAAQHDLGTMHMEGLGVPENPVEAGKWFQLAAQQGDPNAMNNLGILHATGQGVDPDLVAAYMWFTLAAMNGLTDGLDNRAIAAQDMTPEQIAEAQAKSDDWQPK